MASVHQSFAKVSRKVHEEHIELLQRLSELDHALDSLVCYAEVYADLAGVQVVHDAANWLSEKLPAHFRLEEEGILASISHQGSRGAAFAREMKRQHNEIRTRLAAFRALADAFAESADLQQSLIQLQTQGRAFADFAAAHMGTEERKYAAFAA
ncbi:MAG: hemerythrin domain-containing protein [Terriglobales bacterium]|jgi:hypothetical protein